MKKNGIHSILRDKVIKVPEIQDFYW